MAYEYPTLKVPGLIVGADLSSNQYYCVKMSTTNKQVSLCTVDGEVFLGVLQNAPDTSGDGAEVMSLGVTKLEAGETLTAGDFWGTDSNGKGKVIEGTVTGADVGDYVGGVVIEGAASGELATVTIGVPTFRVEAQ